MNEKINEELRLSVSKTKCFNQCKKQYQFNYILKFPKKDRDYHVFGKFCHGVLEYFHQEYLTGCLLPYNIVMNDCFKKAYSEYKDKMTPKMKEDCWIILDKYLRIISEDKKNGKPFNILSVERRFELKIQENILINGAIDRIQLDDDGIIHIADYKTTTNKKYLKDDWFQLLTYCYIVLTEDPSIKKIRGSYILLKHDFEYITKEFSADEILSVNDKFQQYASGIRNETEFAPTTSALCAYCDFLSSCPEGKAKAGFQTDVFGEVSW